MSQDLAINSLQMPDERLSSNYSPESTSSSDGMLRKRKCRSRTKLSQGNKYEILKSDWSEDSVDIYCNVMALMNYLSTGNNLKTEMIFRKAGNISRQRELIKLLNNGSNIAYPVNLTALNASASPIPTSPFSSFPWSRMTRSRRAKVPSVGLAIIRDFAQELTAHDYANALKTVLREVADPILTHDLLPIYVSVSKLTSGNCSDDGFRVPLTPSTSRLARAKQILSLRVLRFLLPVRNQLLLHRLLDLLTETLQSSDINGMSAESLGTIFGPLLFSPCRSSTNLHEDYGALNDLATLMIKQGSRGVFAVPLILANDIHRNLSSEGLLSELNTSKDSDVHICSTYDGDAALHTELTFAEKKNVQEVTEVWKERTKAALNELCVVVNELPDSHPKKATYVRRLSNIYGGSKRNPLREVLESGTPLSLISPGTPIKWSPPDCVEEIPDKAVNLTIPVAPSSSTNLHGSQITCASLAGMLPSNKRQQVRFATPFREALENAKPPVVEDKDLPQIETICRSPDRKRAAVPATVTICSSRRKSYMPRLPVRRSYHLNKLEKSGFLPVPEVYTRTRRST